MAPAVAIFLIVELLFLAGRESFAQPLGFLGAVTAPIVCGVFPMLMLYAARQKGDCIVSGGWGFLGSLFVVAGICAVFLASIAVHGIFVWGDPFRRIVALLTSLVMIGFIFSIRRTAYVPRVAIEVRLDEDPTREPVVNAVARGNSVPIDVEWRGRRAGHEGESSSLMIRLPALPVRELKVWVHRLTGDGASEPLVARIAMDNGTTGDRYNLSTQDGQVIIAVSGAAQRLAISISDIGAVPAAGGG